MKKVVSQVRILTGSSNPKLASDIAKILKLEAQNTITQFADGEIRVSIPVNLRRNAVIIIQPTAPPVNDSLMELLLMIDAAKRASASEITAVVPYFGYSRQDRKDRPRVPVSSALIARMIEMAGADRVLTIDIHSEPEQGFFNGPWDNLFGSFVLVDAVKKIKIKDLVIASPDKGGVPRTTAYARRLNASGIAIVYKERDVAVANKSEALEMVGDVKGKNVLLVDDLVDTAGTLTNAANFIISRGAKSVRAAITHGLFSDPALERINNSQIEEIIVTDTIAVKEKVKNCPKISVVSVAPLLAEAIRRIQTGESISEGLIL